MFSDRMNLKRIASNPWMIEVMRRLLMSRDEAAALKHIREMMFLDVE